MRPQLALFASACPWIFEGSSSFAGPLRANIHLVG